MTVEQQLQLWADTLRSIANEGLFWSGDNPYNVHRFQRIIRIAAEMFAVQDTRDAGQIETQYHADLTHLAPYPVGDAAIFNDCGQILLIQRRDNGLWAMPGGFFEVGETPAEGACREALEETGLAVTPISLIGVYDSRLRGGSTGAHLYQFVFLCSPAGSDAQPLVSNETLDVGWFEEPDLPILDPNHSKPVMDAFRRLRGEMREAVFDLVTPAEA